jgi:hypothetical protein
MIQMNRIDRTFLGCLECRFKGSWEVESGTGRYLANGDDAELRIVRLDGLKRYLAFKNGAAVTLSPMAVIMFDQTDLEESVELEPNVGKEDYTP